MKLIKLISSDCLRTDSLVRLLGNVEIGVMGLLSIPVDEVGS